MNGCMYTYGPYVYGCVYVCMELVVGTTDLDLSQCWCWHVFSIVAMQADP